MKRNQSQYFSDYFNIDKAKLQGLGVFDPIFNFDAKVFVDPLLLKKIKNNPKYQYKVSQMDNEEAVNKVFEALAKD